ncbi:MAG: universal stress protein [Actinomycetota bacterium]|nr:universal stress protein [Actinomycetota bacterium]
MYERIVAGTDFSPTATIATDRAAMLAQRLEAELILVHAGADGGDQLDALARKYGARSAAIPAGNPAEVLINEAERLGADLIAVGSVGMTGGKRFLLGSVPNKVSHHAQLDLLIVKTDPPPKEVRDYAGIMVGTDGSPTAMRAVGAACDLAARLGTTPTIVTVYQPLTAQEEEQLRADPGDPVAQWGSSRSVTDIPDEFRWRISDASHAEDVLDRAATIAEKHGVPVDVRAVEGRAAEALLTLAETEAFDLMVVGSVGMSGTKRFMLGNVPHKVSHHAPTDVLILHTA